ncbi:ABC transporter permease subunit [Candidatus Enterococcus clewellii]|uniref:Uncharacterized protein n=1 Tax=Candidatus Enterococcus clewellii TaxID=1834193 RepID=A0A242K6Q4_9ENTE|nr:ABC transporter permease subunit [Enterococcus sp. 9E7_DIV0242]OTP15990.1 hypothetical protein A5888_002204 [Enterococcus sp. 9E7_DIV0242]
MFEWVKWKRNPKNLLLLGILFVSLAVQLTNQWDRSTRIGAEDHEVLKAMADEIQPPQGYLGTPEPYKMLHHLDENGVFLSEKDEAQYKTVVAILYLLEDENTARNNRAWEEQLAVQTERLTLQKEYIEAGGTEWTLLSLKEVNQQLARNEWLRTKGLTIEEMTASPKGVYFIYSLLQQAMVFGGLILVVALFFFDYLSNEYERKTYLFMSVQPVSKWQRYFRKVKTAVWITGGTYILYLGIGFSVASLLFGTGSVHYPIIVETATTFYPISVGSYILAVASQQLLFMVFIIQILLLLSLVLKNALEVLATFLVLLFLPNILAYVIPAVSHIGQWLPFFYMDVTRYLTEGFGFSEAFLLGITVLVLGNITIFQVSKWTVRRLR